MPNELLRRSFRPVLLALLAVACRSTGAPADSALSSRTDAGPGGLETGRSPALPARSAPSYGVSAGQPVAGALEIGDPYYPGLGNGGYDVEHYHLDLDLDSTSDELSAAVSLRARALHELASFSLDLYGLEVESVLVDGAVASFERRGPAPAADGKPAPPEELVIQPAQPIATGATFDAVVRYGGSPAGRPDPAIPFMPIGWSQTDSGVYVVSECIGASSWFPCNDHPSDKATFSFRVTVDKPYTAAANGVLVEEIDLGERRTFVWKARDPMATYLATIAVAEFSVLELEGPRGIPVRIYHPKDSKEGELAPFRRQPEILGFLETVFGPYPFEAAGAVISYEQIGGALECQTMPVYGRGMNEVVIVHELAHQWFGDCVSPALWRDMWLNEGFASYAEWLWSERERDKEGYERHARTAYQRLRKSKTGSPFDPGVSRVFSSRVYTRGAMVLHGLRQEVGDETFFRILRTWVETFDDANGSTEEFVRHAAEIAGRDLKPFFDAWLFSDVTPELAQYEAHEDEAPADGASAEPEAGG